MNSCNLWSSSSSVPLPNRDVDTADLENLSVTSPARSAFEKLPAGTPEAFSPLPCNAWLHSESSDIAMECLSRVGSPTSALVGENTHEDVQTVNSSPSPDDWLDNEPQKHLDVGEATMHALETSPPILNTPSIPLLYLPHAESIQPSSNPVLGKRTVMTPHSDEEGANEESEHNMNKKSKTTVGSNDSPKFAGVDEGLQFPTTHMTDTYVSSSSVASTSPTLGTTQTSASPIALRLPQSHPAFSSSVTGNPATSSRNSISQELIFTGVPIPDGLQEILRTEHRRGSVVEYGGLLYDISYFANDIKCLSVRIRNDDPAGDNTPAETVGHQSPLMFTGVPIPNSLEALLRPNKAFRAFSQMPEHSGVSFIQYCGFIYLVQYSANEIRCACVSIVDDSSAEDVENAYELALLSSNVGVPQPIVSQVAPDSVSQLMLNHARETKVMFPWIAPESTHQQHQQYTNRLEIFFQLHGGFGFKAYVFISSILSDLNKSKAKDQQSYAFTLCGFPFRVTLASVGVSNLCSERNNQTKLKYGCRLLHNRSDDQASFHFVTKLESSLAIEKFRVSLVHTKCRGAATDFPTNLCLVLGSAP